MLHPLGINSAENVMLYRQKFINSHFARDKFAVASSHFCAEQFVPSVPLNNKITKKSVKALKIAFSSDNLAKPGDLASCIPANSTPKMP